MPWPDGVRWVGQEDGNGCGIACLAMLSGHTYQEVRADFDVTLMRSHVDYDQWLTEQGYALARRYRWWKGAERAAWPPAPWADVHLCEVLVPGFVGGSHMVVMLADGTVLDPLSRESVRRLIDYECVYHVSAVTPYRRHDGKDN